MIPSKQFKGLEDSIVTAKFCVCSLKDHGGGIPWDTGAKW